MAEFATLVRTWGNSTPTPAILFFQSNFIKHLSNTFPNAHFSPLRTRFLCLAQKNSTPFLVGFTGATKGSRRYDIFEMRKNKALPTKPLFIAFALALTIWPFLKDARSVIQPLSDVGMRRAFVMMLCSTPESTFDDESGIGSELSTLVHGHALNVQHRYVAGLDNVLLHIVVGECRSSLILASELYTVYDRVIVVDDEHLVSRALAGYKWQRHLWFKLASLGLMEYQRVVWNGFDTLPVARMDMLFDECKLPPCLDDEGNADLVVIEPNSTVLDQMLAELKASPDIWDGKPQYDMGYFYHYYNKQNITGTISSSMDSAAFDTPRTGTKTVHFTGWNKPYFQAYCHALPDGAVLKTSPGDEGPLIYPKGSPGSKTWCWEDPLRHLLHVRWWKFALEMETALNMSTSIVAQFISLEGLFEKCINVRNAIEELSDNELVANETFVLLDGLNLVEKLLELVNAP